MKIFLSWSKPNSNIIALALKKFIEDFFDSPTNIEFFISSEDIYSGEKWFEKVAKELKTSHMAIICLTKENKFSKWLDFESGAAAFNNENALVCPFLFNIDKLEETNPLNQYQLTLNTEKDLKKLLRQIQDKSGIGPSEKHFKSLFDSGYADLQKELAQIIEPTAANIESEYFDKFIYPTNTKGIHDRKLFLGTPMASIDGEQYLENRREIIGIIEQIKQHCKIDLIYSPVINNEEPDSFEGQEKAMELDFAELKQSEFYMFIYPAKVASSILVEIGYAIALMKKTIIFVKDRKDLPFMLEKCDIRNRGNIKIHVYKDFQDLRKQIKSEGEFMFKFN